MLLGHRYLLPIYIIIDCLILYLIYKYVERQKLKTAFFTICFLGLLSGNLWVYPKKISQGWDSTLAHLPYYELRTQMIDFIKKEKIPLEEIGSAFPNLLSLSYIDLNESEKHFAEKDLSKQEYIFYSNIFNYFTDDEIDDLEQNWTMLKEIKKLNVSLILYQKKQ